MSDEPTTVESTPEAEADAMAALDRVRLPVATLADAIPHLRRPFTPEAIRFKVQTVFAEAKGCIVVAYIDARLASERLNRVIPAGWHAEYKTADGPNLLWCRLTVDGVSRTDVGQSSKGFSKDLVSDALKRAAVHFGVAVSCYALPEIKLMAGTPHVRQKMVKDKPTLVLTEHGMVKLREGYAKWLAEHGIARFGPPLDHGDVVGATIEEVADITSGDGDGSEPGWDGLTDEQVKDVEALLAVAESFGHPLDRASVQMRLNGRPDAVAAWLDEERGRLAEDAGGES